MVVKVVPDVLDDPLFKGRHVNLTVVIKKALYEEMGDPYSEDSIALYKKSPLFHAHNVTKPLMVLQGANDPRVLQVESDEIVEAVRNNGVPVEYVLFDDEGHGFRNEENRFEFYRAMENFLNQQIGDTE